MGLLWGCSGNSHPQEPRAKGSSPEFLARIRAAGFPDVPSVIVAIKNATTEGEVEELEAVMRGSEEKRDQDKRRERERERETHR